MGGGKDKESPYTYQSIQHLGLRCNGRHHHRFWHFCCSGAMMGEMNVSDKANPSIKTRLFSSSVFQRKIVTAVGKGKKDKKLTS